VKRCADLCRLTMRLQFLSRHESLLLLQSFPWGCHVWLHVLRSTPCFRSPEIAVFDEALRTSLSKISNCCLSDDAWARATGRCVGRFGCEAAIRNLRHEVLKASIEDSNLWGSEARGGSQHMKANVAPPGKIARVINSHASTKIAASLSSATGRHTFSTRAPDTPQQTMAIKQPCLTPIFSGNTQPRNFELQPLSNKLTLGSIQRKT